jgi:predicted DNA-binding transcriptional regulator AlpA
MPSPLLARPLPRASGKSFLREQEVLQRLGVGRTTLDEQFIKTGRLRWFWLGPRIKVMIEQDVDRVIDEVIADPASSIKPAPVKKKMAAPEQTSGTAKKRKLDTCLLSEQATPGKARAHR